MIESWFKESVRKLFARYLYSPEKILGFPPSGGFWSSIYPVTVPKQGDSLNLARELVDICRDSLDRDLKFLNSRAKHPIDVSITSQVFGEHYRFLEALSRHLSPQLAIEIGTFRGLGSLALAQYSERLVTFDIKPWQNFTGTALVSGDFSGKLEQIISDLSVDKEWTKYRNWFAQADLIFLDGPKDGSFEPLLIPKIINEMKIGSVLVIDDIRFLNMCQAWNAIEQPKFDITSFAHFSGTGVIRKLY